MTKDTVGSSVQDGVAVLTMDHAPVNSLSLALREDLVDALDRAIADPQVGAIVLIGNAAGFSAGADVKEFGTPLSARAPNGLTLMQLIEDSPKPVVAAIAGHCLGGGLELALCAHFRVARPDASVGLPEVRLGLLPGGGGTQRLPRLVGLETGLHMILQGAVVPAASLAHTALFDHMVDGDLLAGALDYTRTLLARGDQPQRVRERRIDDPYGAPLLRVAAGVVAAGKDRAYLPARQACLEAVAASFHEPFDAGIAVERAGFLALLQSSESRALRHIFKAERAAAKLAGIPAGTATRPVRSVGVIGAGTMGGGIAMSFAAAGIAVLLLESGQQALDRGMATIRSNWESTLAKGRLTRAQLEARLAAIRPTLSYQDLADCDLVIEAVFEDIGVKEQVFRRLDAVCKPGAILASNTSALDLDRIAGFTRRPQDVVGLHFFSPANVMRLLEVVRGARTAPDVLATVMPLARRIGKVAVVAGVCDGFIGNRMLARYLDAANALVEAGALPQQVDGALQRFGLKMGPFRMGDLAGLDIGYATRRRRAQEAGVPWSALIADRLVEAGRLGQKSGAGWYRYEAGRREPLPDPATEALIADYRAAHGMVPRRISDAEVVERCVYALVNEGARILQEGIAARASDIDVVYLNGYGFPAERGGPMFHADLTGLPNVVRALRRFAAEPGAPAWWAPAPMLLELAGQGRNFN